MTYECFLYPALKCFLLTLGVSVFPSSFNCSCLAFSTSCILSISSTASSSPRSFLCSDHVGKQMITKLVFNLWMAIEQYMTRPRMAKDHKSIIDAFMNDDLADDPVSSDELPF